MSETLAKENVRSYTMLDNYQMCHTHRQNKQGGGVSIYIKNNLDFNKIDVFSTNNRRCNGDCHCINLH